MSNNGGCKHFCAWRFYCDQNGPICDKHPAERTTICRRLVEEEKKRNQKWIKKIQDWQEQLTVLRGIIIK